MLITMDDSGSGVPEGLAASIFESGVTTKSAEAPRGFGLALVQQIAYRRLGQVAVEMSPLGGARFVASLSVPTRDCSGAAETAWVP